MELIIKPLQLPEEIQSNIADLKADVAVVMEKYNGVIVSEGGIDDAKKDRAKLNAAAKAFNDRRIEIERQYMAPFNAFKAEIAEIVGTITEAAKGIDVQIKAFEDKAKAEKTADIENLYKAAFGNFTELVPLERVWNPKWLNKGATLKEIDKELCASAKRIALEIITIRGLRTEHEAAVMDKYLSVLNLATALDENKRLTEQAEALKKVQPAPTPDPPQKLIAQDTEATANDIERLKAFCLRLWATKPQRTAIKEFFAAQGIRWETMNIKKEA